MKISVVGRSMEPTLYAGDRIAFRYFPRGLGEVEQSGESGEMGRLRELRGDELSRALGKIILIRRKAEPELLTVKRLIKILDTGLWVEGDNPEASTDSRSYLTISRDEVIGIYLFRYRRSRLLRERRK